MAVVDQRALDVEVDLDLKVGLEAVNLKVIDLEVVETRTWAWRMWPRSDRPGGGVMEGVTVVEVGFGLEELGLELAGLYLANFEVTDLDTADGEAWLRKRELVPGDFQRGALAAGGPGHLELGCFAFVGWKARLRSIERRPTYGESG